MLKFGKKELFRILKSVVLDNQLIVTNPARQQFDAGLAPGGC